MREINRTKGFTVKVKPHDYALLKVAAEAESKKLTEFVRDTAVASALEILDERAIATQFEPVEV